MYSRIKSFFYNNSGGIAVVSGVVTMGCAAYLFWSMGSQFTTSTFGLYASTSELTKALTSAQKIIMTIFLTNVSICVYAGEICKTKYNANNQGAVLNSVTVDPTVAETNKIEEIRVLEEELRPLLNSYPNSRNKIVTVTINDNIGCSSSNESRPRLSC